MKQPLERGRLRRLQVVEHDEDVGADVDDVAAKLLEAAAVGAQFLGLAKQGLGDIA